MSGRILRKVIGYSWLAEGGPITLDALAYWPPFPGIRNDGKRSFIVVAEEYQECSEPDQEVLECGHIIQLRRWNSNKIYNRSRVCRECALSSHGPIDSD